MSMKSKPIVLVTGGGGFIGTHLCHVLVSEGHSVRILDIRDPSTVLHPVSGVEYVQGDVRDERVLSRCLEGVGTVYHFAAVVSVPICQNEPDTSYDVNFVGTLRVLEAVRRANLERGTLSREHGGSTISVVFASTAALYGDQGNDMRAVAETDVASEPPSFYAAQKLASEHALMLYRKRFGIPAVAFRFFNVFGPGQDPSSPYSGVITVFQRLAKEGRELPLNGGGSQTRDFISVFDIVEGCLSAVRLPQESWDGQIMNLGTGRRLSIRQLAEMIRVALGSDSKIVDAPPREGDVIHSLASIQKAADRIRFKPAREISAEYLRELFG